VRVFAWLRRERQVSHQLVLAGGNGWLCEDVYSTVQKEGVEDAVVFTGRIPDEELIELYNAAELFVYPSLYEGFGLPVLEAMACGAPVVVSNSSSLPEVVGDAGVLVSPTNDRDLGEAILELSRNPARRAELSERGKARAAQFSWKRSAEVVLDVFRRSAGAH
jgi:glycosyltransferase involved in cell wall biosynthesis